MCAPAAVIAAVSLFAASQMSRRQQIMMQTDVTGSLEDGNYSARVFEATPEQRHASYKEMGMPSMELWDGSVVPNYGKMGADQMDDGLDMVREGLTDPAKIKEFDEFRATNPFAKPEKIENMINRLVPGSTEQVMGDLGDSISASARMNGGGLVLGFAGGGFINKLPQVRAAKWLGNKAKGAFNFAKDKIAAKVSDIQKPRVDHIHPPADPVSNAGAAQVAQSSGDAATASTEPAPGIPNFDAGMMRSQSKIRTLGVSV